MIAAPARLDVLQRLLDRDPEAVYLEIGVSHGVTFRQIRARTKIAVDPRFRFRVPVVARLRQLARPRTGALYFEIPSDVFFERHGARLLAGRGLDVAFVDGLHEWEQALRDVEHALDYLNPGGHIVLHDCSPQSEAAAAPTLAAAQTAPGYDGAWNGDIYKTIVHLRTSRPDLDVCVIDADQGLGIVTRAPVRPSGKANAPAAASVDALTYSDLAADRDALLNLVPLEAWQSSTA